MPASRKTRLATYAAAATGTICSSGHADIQVYDGPAIPIDLAGVSLALPGLEIDLGIATRSFSMTTVFTWWTCCTSTGGPTCQWSDLVVQNELHGSRILSVFDAGGVSTVDFLDIGKAVEGLRGSADYTAACRFTYRNIVGCGEVDSVVGGDCGEVNTKYLGFTAPKDGGTVHGWIEVERQEGGSYVINRWAYQDDGSPILTGEVPPTPCLADLDGDGVVNSADLGLMLVAWGDCGKKGDCPADLDGNRRVDSADIGGLLAAWGACPEDPCRDIDCASDDPCELVACIDGVCYIDRLEEGDCGFVDCCVAHPGPGCSSEPCMEEVCLFVPTCCTDSWDDLCADLANAFCDECS